MRAMRVVVMAQAHPDILGTVDLTFSSTPIPPAPIHPRLEWLSSHPTLFLTSR